MGDQTVDIWNKFTGPIGMVLNTLIERIGFGKAEIGKFEQENGTLGPLLERLRLLRVMSVKLGYSSIYILIDRVDENALTGTADRSYQFISTILNDLQVLELEGFAFKFFLWNLLLDDYRKVARPDRVKQYVLQWTPQQLQDMLSLRLKAYSTGAILSLDSIADSGLSINLDSAITYFAQGSPRNVVRICKEILDQQSHLEDSVKRLSQDAVRIGFEHIADNISHELYSDTIIRELQKTKMCDFGIKTVYSDVFKISQPAALNKIRSWQETGAVEQLGTFQESKSARSSNLYGISNLLLGKYIFAHMPISEFVRKKLRTCPNCNAILLRDWDRRVPQNCHRCQHEVN